MQSGEGGALLSEQLSECLCVCSRLALFVSQRQTEECSKEITWLINMILAAVQQSARLQKELGAALKYKTNAKQMMEEMRAVIEQQRAIIRASHEKSQLLKNAPTADQSTNTDDSYDRVVDENQQLKHAVEELRGLAAKQSAELHDIKVAREAQEKVLKLMYQEHQSTLAKCAKLENSLKTMKTAVQQVLYPRDARVEEVQSIYKRSGMSDGRLYDKPPRRSRSRDNPRHDTRNYADWEEGEVEEQDEAAEDWSRSGTARAAGLSEPECAPAGMLGQTQPSQASSQTPTKSSIVVSENTHATRQQNLTLHTRRQAPQEAMETPALEQEQNKADPVHRYDAAVWEDEEEEEDKEEEEEEGYEDEDEQNAPGLEETRGSDFDEASDDDEDDDDDDQRVDELSSGDEGSAADGTSSQEHDSLDELSGSNCDEVDEEQEPNESPSLQQDLIERLSESLESSVAVGENDGRSDPSTSQDRPDDSISHMQRFYSSLLLDDVLS